MLFSEKENVFMCLVVTKFILRKMNFGVWFIQTFLQKIHQIRQDKQNASTSGAIVRRARSSARRDLGSLSLIWALSSLSLSLSLSLRKWFEVKMREENHFRVKGENIGQPKVIFRKISFSVTAKLVGFTENDFWKRFSPNSNTALIEIDIHPTAINPFKLI